jgi:Leucine-rich repeat (LRR) protein
MMVISAILAFLVAVGGFFFYESKKAPEPPTAQTQGTGTPLHGPAFTSVNRSGQHLTEMPKDILSMTNLRELNLSNNSLTGALPAEIRHLSNLEVLNISNNKMTGLPAEIGQLSKLRILNAANNQLTGIPHEIGNLQNLELLDLSGNSISKQDLDIIRATLPASTEIRL